MPPEEHYVRRESDKRLDRIEAKLDQVADALQSLARTEEKILAMNSRLNVLEKKMEQGYNDHIKLIEAAKDNHMTSMILDRVVMRLDVMETQLEQMRVESAKSHTVQGAFERGFWVIFTGVVGSIIYFLRGE